MSILWYGSTISCHKSFGKWNCRLCTKKQILILGEIRKCKESGEKHLINSASELYGACSHRPSFYRYSVTQTSTDKGQTISEKSVNEFSTSTPNSHFSPHTEYFDIVCREVSSIDGLSPKRAVNMKGESYKFSLLIYL